MADRNTWLVGNFVKEVQCDSMVNPGAFRGKHKVFLMDEQEDYVQAVKEDRAAEQVADVFRRYLKHFPIALPDDVDPSDEELAKVDDSVPDPE
ncbi:uncharacterized protein ARMOST_22494 [Armillaria ostoyae]|uniref:Uncharacterized protein n=1 Tax=Armillaria ostoyae TaxID=47428 RepID=A0A284SD02_ARMOS|nr:uncharacterized protein ARMOST_22494 [Armillaria ostoyae]